MRTYKKLCVIFVLINPLFFATATLQKYSSKWSSSLPKQSQFIAEEDFQKRVHFWVDIYSKYTTDQGVFHNVNSPSEIYGMVDLSAINKNSVLNNSEKIKRTKKLIENQRAFLMTKYNIKNSQNIRLQMGLKNRMEKALYLSGQYLPMMEKVFKEKNLPIELTRIVFVESSFNIHAQSKVGASGLWQIMPSVGRAEGYVSAYYDKRNHPYYASLLAANILKKNYDSLQSWPLAITAYNHGLTGVRRMSNRVGSNHIQDLIESEDPTKSWGFASQNFYSCFLAVLQVEKNATFLFGEDLLQAKPLQVKNIYLKNNITKNEVLKMFDGSHVKLRSLNPHLRIGKLQSKKYFPAGLLLTVPQNKYL